MLLPSYYRVTLEEFDETYFKTLLNFLNISDKTLGAVLMKCKDGYEVFTNRPLTTKEGFFLYVCTQPIIVTEELD